MSIESLQYAPPPGRFDEVLAPDGTARESWQSVARALGSFDPAVLLARQRQSDRLLEAEGTGHLVHDIALAVDRHGVPLARRSASHPWRLDPIPYVLAGSEWEMLAATATQRMRAIEALLSDCYGAQRLVRDGVLPASALFALASYRPATVGSGGTGRWLTHYALDVVRDADGVWHVVHDAVQAPSGLGYALLNRSALARLLPDALRTAGAATIHDHADVLRRALSVISPAGRLSPRTVVLTEGPDSDTYVEHSYLASRLGYHLVEGADVVMREGRMWLRALDGLEPIDVVYRRIDDAHLDPCEPGHRGGGGGVPGVVWGAARGGVALANAYGAGLAESRTISELLGPCAAHLLGDRLQLGLLAPQAALATSPVFDPAVGAVVPRTVVLRLQVARYGDDYVVMRGGVGRVLADGDDPAHPTAVVAKDVWVVGLAAVGRPASIAAPPQVDYRASVPKRVADAMYWLGRSAERAEAAARTARVVAQQLDQDSSMATLADGAWTAGAAALLLAARGSAVAPASSAVPSYQVLGAELAAAVDTVAAQLASVVHEATSVREYLSTTTGRVLGRLALAQARLAAPHPTADELDTVLVDLAALAGLATESTVRGPAWRFLDMGRRIERALVVLGAVEAVLGPAVPALALQPLADALLAADESLVAYRRRYRSDVDLTAVLDLLVHDDANPRSVAYQLDRLREHAAGLAWPEGQELVHQASIGALVHVGTTVVNGRRLELDAMILGVRGPLLALADAVVARWFADPVRPTVVRGVVPTVVSGR